MADSGAIGSVGVGGDDVIVGGVVVYVGGDSIVAVVDAEDGTVVVVVAAVGVGVDVVDGVVGFVFVCVLGIVSDDGVSAVDVAVSCVVDDVATADGVGIGVGGGGVVAVVVVNFVW